MTYLDSRHTRQQADPARWLLRVLIMLAIAAFGWFALTVGMDGNGRTEIVQEPITRSF